MATKTKKPVKQVEKQFDPLMEVLFHILPEMNSMDMENDEDYDTEKGFDDEDTNFIHACVLRLIFLAREDDDEFAWTRSESISCNVTSETNTYRLTVDFDYFELNGSITLEYKDGVKDAYIKVRHYSRDFDTTNELTTHFTSLDEVLKIIKSNVNTLRKKCLRDAAKKYGLKIK